MLKRHSESIIKGFSSRKREALFYLYQLGFTYQELQTLWKVSSKSINKAIKEGSELSELSRKA